MPSELNRRALFAALAAFVLALAVAYALSGTGEASEVSGSPAPPAQPLDVASGIAGQTTLGAAEALPALVRKPKPPAKKPQSVNTSKPAAPSTPAPSTPTFTPPPPPLVSSPPVNSQPSTPSEPPVQFEASG